MPFSFLILPLPIKDPESATVKLHTLVCNLTDFFLTVPVDNKQQAHSSTLGTCQQKHLFSCARFSVMTQMR